MYKMLCLRIRVAGFGNTKREQYEVCVEGDVKVSNLLEEVKKVANLQLNQDEIMIVCNDRQIYLEEYVPKDCETLVLFPLALGGRSE